MYNCDWHLEYDEDDRFRKFDYDQLKAEKKVWIE